MASLTFTVQFNDKRCIIGRPRNEAEAVAFISDALEVDFNPHKARMVFFLDDDDDADADALYYCARIHDSAWSALDTKGRVIRATLCKQRARKRKLRDFKVEAEGEAKAGIRGEDGKADVPSVSSTVTINDTSPMTFAGCSTMTVFSNCNLTIPHDANGPLSFDGIRAEQTNQ